MATRARKFAIIFLSVCLAFILLLCASWLLLHRAPAWYQPAHMSAEQRENAAQSATNKFVTMQNAAVEARAAEISTSGSPATAPAAITLDLSDEELNAFFEKWMVWQNAKSAYASYIGDPYLVFQPGKIIVAGRPGISVLAGNWASLGAVISLEFEPQLQSDGQLSVQLKHVRAGRLPVPKRLCGGIESLLIEQLQKQMPRWRKRAKISSTGSANGGVISASLGEMLIDLLQQRTTPAIFFLPVVDRGAMPVKVTELEVGDRVIHVTLVPLDEGEREKLLAGILGKDTPQ